MWYRFDWSRFLIILYANVTAAVVGGCCRPSCFYHNMLTYCFITHTSSFCKSIKIPLKAIFCAAVFWWLIWLRNHTSLPQQTHRGAQMNRSRPPNLPVVEKECATSFLLNSFISVTSWVFPFAELNGGKKRKSLWRNISLSTEEAFWKVYFQSEAGEVLLVSCSCSQFFGRHTGLCLYKQQRGSSCSRDECHGLYVWMTGGLLIMFLIARLLTSVTLSLSLSLSSAPPSLHLPNTHPHTLAHMHTLFC